MRVVWAGNMVVHFVHIYSIMDQFCDKCLTVDPLYLFQPI